jgi:hypothetical protein
MQRRSGATETQRKKNLRFRFSCAVAPLREKKSYTNRSIPKT